MPFSFPDFNHDPAFTKLKVDMGISTNDPTRLENGDHMSQAYSDPTPKVEVFQLTAIEVAEIDDGLVDEYLRRLLPPHYSLASMNSKVREAMLTTIVDVEQITGGWYWWACFPGCMPDGDPIGPFNTQADALADAQDID
jgi:hypothetical protein